jgi:threonine dehydratase
VRVEDAEILDALRALFCTMKLAVEPAAAAALAAVRGPLRNQVRCKRVGIVLCGSNIDPQAYAHFLTSGTTIQRSSP